MISNTILSIAFITSLIINGVLVWYAYKLTKRYLLLSESLDDLTKLITSYRNHLKAVYEMETFYGDENLQALLDHTKSLSVFLEDYEDAIDILEPLETIEEEINEENEEENQIEKDVFYAGSRRRNS